MMRILNLFIVFHLFCAYASCAPHALEQESSPMPLSPASTAVPGQAATEDVTLPPPAPAEPATSEMTAQSYEGAFLKMFLTLLGLIVAIFFGVWGLKKLSKGRFYQANANRTIKILERRPLSPKTMLYLIEVCGKQAVITESQLEVKRVLSLEDFETEEEESDR
jgi:flagellar protein FliO/FliZ